MPFTCDMSLSRNYDGVSTFKPSRSMFNLSRTLARRALNYRGVQPLKDDGVRAELQRCLAAARTPIASGSRPARHALEAKPSPSTPCRPTSM